MNQYEPLIQEFVARKTQVLNLEVRLFVLIFALEASMVVFYVLYYEHIRKERKWLVIAFSVYFALFLEMVAVNGKMGVISLYLRQMENYLRAVGYEGVVWESKALDAIIFKPGNAFTLPAFLTALVLYVQNLYAFGVTIKPFIVSTLARRMLIMAYALLMLGLLVKTLSVDFFNQVPNIFMN